MLCVLYVCVLCVLHVCVRVCVFVLVWCSCGNLNQDECCDSSIQLLAIDDCLNILARDLDARNWFSSFMLLGHEFVVSKRSIRILLCAACRAGAQSQRFEAFASKLAFAINACFVIMSMLSLCHIMYLDRVAYGPQVINLNRCLLSAHKLSTPRVCV